jgi:hypothetical protein
MDKAQAKKELWEIHEELSKMLKKLTNNSVASAYADKYWKHLAEIQKSLRCIDDVEVGVFYQLKGYEDDCAILKFTDYTVASFQYGDMSFAVRFRFLCSSKERILSIGFNGNPDYVNLPCNNDGIERLKPYTLDLALLPTMLDYTFKGPMFEELLKGKSN